MSRLEEIEARVQAATPGPWKDSGDFYMTVDGPGPDDDVARDVRSDGDRAFIAHAREDVPWLLAEVRRLSPDDRTEEHWKVERAHIVQTLRNLCASFGDNDWSENLHLSDVLNRHIRWPDE